MNPDDPIYNTDEWREFLDGAMTAFSYSSVSEFTDKQMADIRNLFRLEYEGAFEPELAPAPDPEPDPEPSVGESDLTKTQSQRFDNIVERVAKKIEGTFGKTVEDFYIVPRTDGEVPGQAIQRIAVQSRGVMYTFTVQAEKLD